MWTWSPLLYILYQTLCWEDAGVSTVPRRGSSSRKPAPWVHDLGNHNPGFSPWVRRLWRNYHVFQIRRRNSRYLKNSYNFIPGGVSWLNQKHLALTEPADCSIYSPGSRRKFHRTGLFLTGELDNFVCSDSGFKTYLSKTIKYIHMKHSVKECVYLIIMHIFLVWKSCFWTKSWTEDYSRFFLATYNLVW